VSKTIKIKRPLVVPLSRVQTGKALHLALSRAKNHPVVFTEASNAGFSSDTVVVLDGNAKTEDQEKVLSAVDTPVLSKAGFIEVLKSQKKHD